MLSIINTKTKKNLVCNILIISLHVLLLLVLVFDLGLPLSYISLAALICATMTYLVVHDCGDNQVRYSLLLGILCTAIILRMLYMIRTRFQVEPLYDGYKNLVVAYLFMKEGRANVIPYPSMLSYASSFPLLDILNIMLASVTSYSILKSALFLSLSIGYSTLLTIYLIGKKFAEAIEPTQKHRCSLLFLVFLAISPELIYWSMVYYPRNYCLAIYHLLMYLIIVQRYPILALILMLALPLSYSLFPVMIILLLTTLALEKIILRTLRGKSWLKQIMLTQPTLKLESYTLIGLLIGELSVLAYYTSPSVILGCRGFLSNIANLWLHVSKPVVIQQLHAPYWIPPVLKTPLNVLTHMRDTIIYAPSVLGLPILTYLWIRRKVNHDIITNVILLIPAYLVLYIIFIIGCRIGINAIICLTTYLIILASSLIYYMALRKTRNALKFLIASLIFIAAFTAFLSPWSHRVLLRHYYESSISFVEAGDHNPHYIYVDCFLHKYLVFKWVTEVHSDDPVIAKYILWTINPSLNIRSQHNSIDVKRFLYSNNSISIVFLGPHIPSGPYGWLPLNIKSVYLEKVKALLLLNGHANLIYKAGRFIYIHQS